MRQLVPTSRTDFHPPLHLFANKKELLVEITRPDPSQRLDNWLMFFDEYEHHPFFFYQKTITAIQNAFYKNDIIANQTQVEFELSKAFYEELLRNRKPRILSDQTAADKLLQLSLIFGKYPGMFRSSFIRYFDKSPDDISSEFIDDLFKHCLVKYEKPEYIIRNFQCLNEQELEILMLSLTGKNLRKHSIFKNKCKPREFSSLMQLEAAGIQFENKIILRGLILTKILEQLLILDPDPDFFDDTHGKAYIFLKSSPTFQNNPERYLQDVQFWERAAEMVVQITSDFQNHLNITDCVDFLEYHQYHSEETYSLQGRTVASLSRAIHEWHNRVYNEQHLQWIKSKWTARPEHMDLHFEHEQITYTCKQLLSGKELDKEGKTMKHCVMTYAPYCLNGQCSIWSLRKKEKSKFRVILTIEVIDTVIVQARRKLNELPTQKDLAILQDWSQRMNFTVDLYKNQ